MPWLFWKKKKFCIWSEYQNLWEKNWGLYFVPFVGLGNYIMNIKKDAFDNCSDVWHLYIDRDHEV